MAQHKLALCFFFIADFIDRFAFHLISVLFNLKKMRFFILTLTVTINAELYDVKAICFLLLS
jgi:hypothetical protein